MVNIHDDQIEIESLLPFYVNGTLNGHERARIEVALGADGDLRTQVAALKQVRASMNETDGEQSPGQFGLARLMRDIDKDTKSTDYRPKQSGLLAAAVVAVAVAIGGALFVSRSDVGYQQASGGADTQHLSVAFQPDAPQLEVSQLLLEFGLGIVEGPSAIGLYRLDPGRNGDLVALLFEIRSRIDLVESIQLE